MSGALASLLFLAALASPSVAVPTVSLLIDNGYASTGTLNIKTVLQNVSTKKGQAFHFGSTYDTYDANAAWTATIFETFFNHVVAENSCKWDSTETSEGVSTLTSCEAVESYATEYSNSFRGHNTFWHSQLPVCMTYLKQIQSMRSNKYSLSVLASR